MMVKRRGFALILAIAMLMSVLGGMAIAADPAAGEEGYVSLHTYATTTDDPSIIKVTHTVQAKITVPKKLAVFVLDASGSMAFQGTTYPNEVMAPFGSNIYGYAGYDSLYTTPIGTRPAATYDGGNFYDWDGSTPATQQAGQYLFRWKAMMNHAVPAAIDILWNSADPQQIQESTQIGVVTFGSSLIAQTPGGAADLYQYTDKGTVLSWVAAQPTPTSGTQIQFGLEQAYKWFDYYRTTYPTEVFEPYVLALTDGADSAQANANSWAAALKATKGSVQPIPGGSGFGQGAKIWAITLNNNGAAIHTFMSGLAGSSGKAFNDVYTVEEAVKVFDEFATMVKGADGVEAKINTNSSAFDIVQVPGKPLYELAQSDGGMDMTVVKSGSSFDWQFIGSLKDGVVYSLTYYLQTKDGKPGLSYDVLSSSSFTYSYTDALGVTHDVAKAFPSAYVAASTGESVEGDGTLATDSTTDRGYTGKDGHQDNRDNAKTTTETMGYTADIQPIIKGIRAGTAASGRAKAIVDVENGSLMRYQWQVKNESGQWEDIFGATSSQYTLSAKFKAGETYELRCKITNPAGAVTYSEILKVEATAATKGGSLQSK